MMPAVEARTRQALEVHRASGRRFEAGGITSFVREQGRPQAAPVVLMHGVPSSSFLYRRVLPELADQGLRGVAFDLPGLGLADRPRDFDYSWSGLAAWTGRAIDALGIDRCHLVVHDIGGPIGCEWAVANPDRVLSLTVLNTMLSPATYRIRFPMSPFARPLVGRLWLAAIRPPTFQRLWYWIGIADRAAVPRHEVLAHYELVRLGDRGRTLLRIMRGFELTDAKERLLAEGLARRRYPARVVWGRLDHVLGLDLLRLAQRAVGVDDALLIEAKHFLQEDHPREVAQAITDLAAPLG